MIFRLLYKIIILAVLIITGCRGTSKIPEDDYLYTGAGLKFNFSEKIEQKGELTQKMERFLQPEPNMSILGIRPKVWFYNLYDTLEKEKGFKYWVKHKLGTPPVLLSDVDQDRVASNIRLGLENEGFFNAEVKVENEIKNKTASVEYTATVERPYVFGNIHLPSTDNLVSRAIRGGLGDSKIIKGERFNLQDLQDERLRIESALQNEGFYYFNDTYLLYQIDTTVGNREVEVFMTLKPETPPRAKVTQQINDVIINTDFNFADSLSVEDYDTVQVDNVYYVSKNDQFRPDIIVSHIRLRKNNIYTRSAEEITIGRLIDLGVFRYVNVNFQDAGAGQLNAMIRVSPMKKKSIQVEFRGVTKSNSFVGPAFQASFRNRNFLKGAELYQLRLNAGYEWQLGGARMDANALNSYELGVNNTLSIPRFIAPISISYFSSRFVPQTNFDLGFRFLKRIDYFELNSFDLGYGFRWREDFKKSHRLNPVDINYIRLRNTSEAFDSLINNNDFLARSYQNQFILGSSYGYIYNTQAQPGSSVNTHNFFFNGNVDISGNLMHLVQNSLRSEENTDDDPYTIFGSAYSQFLRSDFDFRYYYRINNKHKIASRFIFGIGKAIGNSVVLPYTKQFSIGGSSSIRAFRARSLGPGSYQADHSNIFFDQAADIKIETNLEYRFDLFGNFKGALFVDAGNIWTIAEDEREGQFLFNNFLSEIAVGAGAGIRLDVEFFVLRLDLATPVKVPSLPAGQRWQLRLRNTNQQTGESVSNILLNIAIGYPF